MRSQRAGIERSAARRRSALSLEEACADGFDAFADACHLVRGEIVENDGVTRREARDKTAVEVGEKDVAVHRPVDDERGDDAVLPQAADKGRDLPMAMRDAPDQALAAAATATHRGHVRARAGLVDEDEATWIKLRLLRDPLLAR